MKRRVTILVAGVVAASLPWLARNYATRKQESPILAGSQQDGEVMFSHDGGSLCLEAPENSDSVLIYDEDGRLLATESSGLLKLEPHVTRKQVIDRLSSCIAKEPMIPAESQTTTHPL